MTADASSLWKFVLRIVLWLPPCFAAWYFSAPYHTAAVGALARPIVDLVKSGLLSNSNIASGLKLPGFDLGFLTTVEIHTAPGATGLLFLKVNPLLYTFGLAFFLALMLASRARWWKILAGAALLLPFQSWGIAFELLLQVSVKYGPKISAQAGFVAWQRESITLAYMIGKLIFPSLVPVVLWAAFNRPFIKNLLPKPDEPEPKMDR